jgi:16S rRNA (adenine1518-N6/adenine1519-N6)-dimethyltransferase
MTLSEMKRLLADGQVQLTKSLGQNFLHDGNQLRRIAAAAALTRSDRVLEIGPGLGPLTELLTAEAGEVLAIEKDRRLFDILTRRFAETAHLVLVQADALDYLREHPRDWSGWKLVANLPYAVASPLLVTLAQARSGPDRMVVTLQLEVARRLTAPPAGPDYGVLTLLIQLHYQPRDSFKIAATCFHPVPQVDSACVVLVRRPVPLLAPEREATFVRLVKKGFSQRRKMMLKLLKSEWPSAALESAFARIGTSPQTRAEAVTLEQFVQLAELLGTPREVEA